MNEPRPEPALSPDEAYAWNAIERALRSEIPVQRIERRATLRADRRVRWAGLAVMSGAVVAVLAALAPAALCVIGALVAGIGIGTALFRTMASLLANRRRRSLFRRL